MIKRWSELEKMLFLSIAFTMLLLATRILITGQFIYIFYAWNLFLAVIPILISRRLCRYTNINWKVACGLLGWLLFLPNAPYIITDIFHFTERPPVPKWVDLLLVTSAAWNGLMLGMISVMQVEQFLHKFLNHFKVNLIVTGCLLLSAFGIYLGRFLRFNSWDVISNPDDLLYSMGTRLIHPQDHLPTWSFTLLFGALLWLIYFTVRKLPMALSSSK